MRGTSPRVLRGFEAWPWYCRFVLDPLTSLEAAQRRYGPLGAIGTPIPLSHSGSDRLHVLAIGAAHNRQVLGDTDIFRPTGQVTRGPEGSAQRRLRYGLLRMHGEKHKKHRRLMQPPFLKPSVADYTGIMARLIDEVIDRWRPGAPLDMYREMRTLSNWVAANILFGNDDFEASIRLGKAIERWLVLDAAARRWVLMLDVKGTAYSRLLKHAAVLETLVAETIERNRRTKTPGSDVLSILIRAFDEDGADVSDVDLISHAVILYAASFETTANVLAWTLFLLAQHPAVATELHQEIDANLVDWPPDPRRVDELPLLDAVVRESMRLMPPVAFTLRIPVEDVEVGGLPMRQGDRVILSAYLTHRVPEVFPQPNRFNPMRWYGSRFDPYEYIPFSAGPRLCLGYSFATLELKLTVARVIQRYRLRVVPGSRIDGVIRLTLRPDRGIPMIVHPQDGAFAAAPVVGNINRMVDLAH